MDAIIPPSTTPRPLLLTERDLTREEIAAMGAEREKSASIYEAKLCEMIARHRREVQSQRALLASVKTEADELEMLRRSMKAGDLAWCLLKDGRRTYRKLEAGDTPKEGA